MPATLPVATDEAARVLARRLGATWTDPQVQIGFWAPQLLERGIPADHVWLEVFLPSADLDLSVPVQEVTVARPKLPMVDDGPYRWVVLEAVLPPGPGLPSGPAVVARGHLPRDRYGRTTGHGAFVVHSLRHGPDGEQVLLVATPPVTASTSSAPRSAKSHARRRGGSLPCSRPKCDGARRTSRCACTTACWSGVPDPRARALRSTPHTLVDMSPSSPPATDSPTPEQEVVQICRELIRIDTSNYGDGSGPGERAAADYVMELLTEVGLDPQLTESDPGRASVVVRTPGRDRSRPGLVLHGHLDVVPAQADDWQVDPFAAEERDGCIWGRGAVDMKDMDAMLLANLRHLARSGEAPPRDIVWAFFADEEAGGVKGAGHVAAEHPEWFEGCTEAISEVGGFSVTLPDQATGGPTRAYLLQTAEKGIAWLRLHAHGRAGHGSVPNAQNAVVRLAEAIARIDAHAWPRTYIASVTELFGGVAAITGEEFDPEDPESILSQLGGARPFIEGTLRDTSNFTMLTSGYKHNVIPQTATASLDCRFLPGHEQDLMDTIAELAGEHVEIEIVHKDVALEAPFEADLVESMTRALLKEDPGARVLPYCLSGGTDNKHLSRLGITGYGFAPLRLPDDLDFVGMFHGIDERVPVDALEFGTRVLGRLIEDC